MAVTTKKECIKMSKELNDLIRKEKIDVGAIKIGKLPLDDLVVEYNTKIEEIDELGDGDKIPVRLIKYNNLIIPEDEIDDDVEDDDIEVDDDDIEVDDDDIEEDDDIEYDDDDIEEEKPKKKKGTKKKELPKEKKKDIKKKDTKKKSEPSNKFLVYKEWKKKKKKADAKDLHRYIKEAVKLGTIRGWIGQWKKGNNLPAGV